MAPIFKETLSSKASELANNLSSDTLELSCESAAWRFTTQHRSTCTKRGTNIAIICGKRQKKKKPSYSNLFPRAKESGGF
jgi:hypothetical protein